MNRKEFMTRLEQLLIDISEEERSDALQYYEDYFDDAGAENEAEVIKELESPEKVAAIIRTDLKDTARESGEYTEWGYADERFDSRETPAMRGEHTKDGDRYSYHQDTAYGETGSGAYSGQGNGAYGGQGNGAYSGQGDGAYSGQGQESGEYAIPPRTNRFLKITLIVLILLVVFPVAVPVFFGVAAAVIGVVAGVFAMFASFVVASVAVAAAGLFLIILGLLKVIVMFPSAVLTIGVGLLMFALGMGATVLTVKLCMVMYPAICRIIVRICRWPFHRRKAVA